MNKKFEQLAELVRHYRNFKDMFDRFCTTAAVLNNNDALPGVSFSVINRGLNATVSFLDKNFSLRFHVIPLNDAHIGILSAYFPAARDEEILIWRTFFDSHGNVRDTPNAATAQHLIWEPEFLSNVIGEISAWYFLHLTKTLQVDSTPTR